MREVECGFASGAQGNGTDLLARYGPTLLVRIGFDRDYRRGGGVPNLHDAEHPNDDQPSESHILCVVQAMNYEMWEGVVSPSKCTRGGCFRDTIVAHVHGMDA